MLRPEFWEGGGWWWFILLTKNSERRKLLFCLTSLPSNCSAAGEVAEKAERAVQTADQGQVRQERDCSPPHVKDHPDHLSSSPEHFQVSESFLILRSQSKQFVRFISTRYEADVALKFTELLHIARLSLQFNSSII